MIVRFILCVIFLVFPSQVFAVEHLVPRTVIALYDEREQSDPGVEWSNIHLFAEMPLNHLGLTLEYFDVSQGLPNISGREDVLGVITWFEPGSAMQDVEAYIDWAITMIDAGKKFVVLGNSRLDIDARGRVVPRYKANQLLRKLGLRDEDRWIGYTYDVNFVHKNSDVMDFERKLSGEKPPFKQLTVISDNVSSHLIARKGNTPKNDSHLVVTSPSGGYVAENYAVFRYYNTHNNLDVRQWYINPFVFFQKAFDTDDVPKPDTTTIAGRRIYYSHIDGDGWLNITEIESYRDKPIYSSEVILEHVILPFPDLPLTVSPIAAELEDTWLGDKNSREVAKKIFSLPNIEVGSHTYTHPFDWSFFEDGDWEKERPLLGFYQYGHWDAKEGHSHQLSSPKQEKQHYEAGVSLDSHYLVPRAYANEPFDIIKEINESTALINAIAPKGKSAQVLQWSGDCMPFEEAVRLAREAGLGNINGGDSRFDRKYNSYAWVPPISRQVGNERQIYASNSNENTYTEEWSAQYHGFKHLVHTLKNTERSRRIKPFNVYYHMYSGEKEASLKALLDNLDYARTQDLVPIKTSNFVDIADGFFTTRFVRLDKHKWRVENRGALQTVRFDNALFKAVSLQQSKGVIGQRHYQGSLYVYLDESVNKPIIALRPYGAEYYHEAPRVRTPYLVESRWKVRDFNHTGKTFRFTAQGYGDAEMTWQVSKDGLYLVIVDDREPMVIEAKEKFLHLLLDDISAITPVKIEVIGESQEYGA